MRQVEQDAQTHSWILRGGRWVSHKNFYSKVTCRARLALAPGQLFKGPQPCFKSVEMCWLSLQYLSPLHPKKQVPDFSLEKSSLSPLFSHVFHLTPLFPETLIGLHQIGSRMSIWLDESHKHTGNFWENEQPCFLSPCKMGCEEVGSWLPLEREERLNTMQSPKRKAILQIADRRDLSGSGDVCAFQPHQKRPCLKRSGFGGLVPDQQRQY